MTMHWMGIFSAKCTTDINWTNKKFEGWTPTYARWWFQIFLIFNPILGRFPIWLIFFKGVETTNQYGYLYYAHHRVLQAALFLVASFFGWKPSWEKKTHIHPSFFFRLWNVFCSLQPGKVTGPVGDSGFSRTKDDALDVVDLYRWYPPEA